MDNSKLLRQCRHALETAGIHPALQVLNASTAYRFTGVYRFADGWVKSVWLYDRTQPSLTFGSDVRWDDSYCRLTAVDGDRCEITDAPRDARLDGHAARESVKSYIAVLLRCADASPFGTLCHYDVEPRRPPAGAIANLRAVRSLFERRVQSELAAPL